MEELVQRIEEAEEEEQDFIAALLSLAEVFDGRIGVTHARVICEHVNWTFVGEAFDNAVALLHGYVEEEAASTKEREYTGFRVLQLAHATRLLVEQGHEALDISVERGVAMLQDVEEYFVQEECRRGTEVATSLIVAQGAVLHQQRRALALRIVETIENQYVLRELPAIFANVMHFYKHAGMTARAAALFDAHFAPAIVAEAEFNDIHCIFEIAHNIDLHEAAPRQWGRVRNRILERVRTARELPLLPDGTPRDNFLRTLLRLALQYNVMPLREMEDIIVEVQRNTGGVTMLTLHNLLHDYRLRKDFADVERFYGYIQEHYPEAVGLEMAGVVIDSRMRAVPRPWEEGGEERKRQEWERCFALMCRVAPVANFCVGSLALHSDVPQLIRILEWCEAEDIELPTAYTRVYLTTRAPRRDVYLRCLARIVTGDEAVLAAALPHSRRWGITAEDLITEFRERLHTWPSCEVLSALISLHLGDAGALVEAYAHDHHVKPSSAVLASMIKGLDFEAALALIRRFHVDYGVVPTVEVLANVVPLARRNQRNIERVVDLATDMNVLPTATLLVEIVIALMSNRARALALRWYHDERFAQSRSGGFWRRLQYAAHERCPRELRDNVNLLLQGLIRDITWIHIRPVRQYFSSAIYHARHHHQRRAVQEELLAHRDIFEHLQEMEAFNALMDKCQRRGR